MKKRMFALAFLKIIIGKKIVYKCLYFIFFFYIFHATSYYFNFIIGSAWSLFVYFPSKQALNDFFFINIDPDPALNKMGVRIRKLVSTLPM